MKEVGVHQSGWRYLNVTEREHDLHTYGFVNGFGFALMLGAIITGCVTNQVGWMLPFVGAELLLWHGPRRVLANRLLETEE